MLVCTLLITRNVKEYIVLFSMQNSLYSSWSPVLYNRLLTIDLILDTIAIQVFSAT